ncbi:MAG: hypothetical protein HOH20_14210 [Rhodospirillaceae bacterium]|jgi:hypothetical protein|nr:hypothetical protein [Rhodospirillaceae bacterium]MBT5566635.1 hypothetical protein [Rhodospirillaceae bacterium]MBT6090725.1 hypothetical protein [Rhodospirillaceae bacterium]
MRNFLHFFLVVVALTGSASAAVGDALFEPQVPDEISIFTVGRDTKKYWTQLASAVADSSLTIRQEYKNKISANVQFQDTLGRNVFSTSKIRITGDWKDHLDLDRVRSSLSVELKNENIGNIVKFRLLLPRTRRGSGEIFWSILMEELGYPVPFRKLITVNFNDYVSYPAIFEEAADKEFLERFKFRESPIVESDERQHWTNVAWRTDNENCLSNRNENNECITDDWSRFESYKVDNASFVKNDISALIALKAFNIEKVLGSDYDEINRVYAPHGLDEHNRKRIYDPIYGVHVPVYVDGDVNITNCEPSDAVEISRQDQIALDRLAWKFRLRTKEYLSPAMRCVASEILSNAERITLPETVNAHEMSLRDYYAFQPLTPYPDVRPEIIGYDPTDDSVKTCRIASVDNRTLSDCRALEFVEKRKYVVGNGDPVTSGIYDVFPAVVGKLSDDGYSPGSATILSLEPSVETLSVPQNATLFVKLSPAHKGLAVNYEDATTSRLVIYQSKLSADFTLDAKIPFAALDVSESEEDARYDRHLLTSCLTFMDTVFSGGSIHVDGGGCEDSLNFIRASGFLSKVSVTNASSDAIDADFSRIDIKDLSVSGAGNDCLDLSAGYYNVAQANLKNCGDKAVSAGERARVAIGVANISNATVGLASKDTSELYVSNMASDESSVPTCAAVYRKKQEYNGADLIVGKATACANFDTDEASRLELESASTCLYLAEINGVEICVTERGISVVAEDARPAGYILSVTEGPGSVVNDEVSEQLRAGLAKCDFATPCKFFVGWKGLPGEFLIDETKSLIGSMARVSVNLSRLGYAE